MKGHEPNVAIFWDFENCRPPSTASGFDIVNNICKIAHEYGSVKLFKAYLEISEQSSPSSDRLRSDLQSCGVSLTDCPHNGRKDVADKMMIVDMLTFAIDTPAPATIVMISGDRDFVYAVSVLRLRKYSVVLVAPKAAHFSLKSQASVLLYWEVDILGKPAKDSTQRPLEAEITGNTNAGLHRRARTSSSSIAATSSNIERPQRRLSFRDIDSGVTPKVELLQPAAPIDSPRIQAGMSAQTTPAEGAEAGTADTGRSIQSLPHFTPPLSPLPATSNLPTYMAVAMNITKPTLTMDAKRVPDIHMHLKNFQDHSSSCSSSDYQTPTSMPLEVLRGESPTIIAPPGVMEFPLPVESTADAGSHTPPIRPQSAPPTTSSSSPPPQILHQVHEQSNALEFDILDNKAEEDNITSRPPPMLSIEYRRGSLTVWSNSSEDLDTLDALSLLPKLQQPFEERPTTKCSTPVRSSFHSQQSGNQSSAADATLSCRSPPPAIPEAPSPVACMAQPEPQPPLLPLPPQFIMLVQILERMSSNGFDKPLRSLVAIDLMARDPRAYQLAGVARWDDYAALAEKAGIVVLGGLLTKAWVSLTPLWRDRTSALNSASSVRIAGTDTTSASASEEARATVVSATATTTYALVTANTSNSATSGEIPKAVVPPATVDFPDDVHEDTRSVRSAPAALPTAKESGNRPHYLEPPSSSGEVTTLGVTPTTPEEAAPMDKASSTEALTINLQTKPSSSALPPIPVHFLNLLLILEEYRADGIHKPPRGTVAATLLQWNPETYSLAGFARWRDYAAAAVKLGMVTLGQQGKITWISLNPTWYGRVSANKHGPLLG